MVQILFDSKACISVVIAFSLTVNKVFACVVYPVQILFDRKVCVYIVVIFIFQLCVAVCDCVKYWQSLGRKRLAVWMPNTIVSPKGPLARTINAAVSVRRVELQMLYLHSACWPAIWSVDRHSMTVTWLLPSNTWNTVTSSWPSGWSISLFSKCPRLKSHLLLHR